MASQVRAGKTAAQAQLRTAKTARTVTLVRGGRRARQGQQGRLARSVLTDKMAGQERTGRMGDLVKMGNLVRRANQDQPASLGMLGSEERMESMACQGKEALQA